jgi:hypothetical protein
MFYILMIVALFAAFIRPALAQGHVQQSLHSGAFSTTIDASGNSHVQFGNGTHGQAPPAGSKNVTATYRVGGSAGRNKDRR